MVRKVEEMTAVNEARMDMAMGNVDQQGLKIEEEVEKLRAAELVLYSRINHAYRRLKEYLASNQTWSTNHAGVLGSKPVAYFSAEFGIHESLPIYSGGLGILSGDHLKSCSDQNYPVVGLGLLYQQGYFRQFFSRRIKVDRCVSHK